MLRRILPSLWFLALVVSALAAVPAAEAEHSPHHRYYFAGTVRTDSGDPVCGIAVRAAEGTSTEASGRNRTAVTDRTGRYEIQLHLHSGLDPEAQPSDLGRSVNVTVAGITRTVTLQPNEGHPDGWGQLTVDITVPGSLRGPVPCLPVHNSDEGPGGISVIMWVLVLVAVTVAIVLAVLALLRHSSSQAGSPGGSMSDPSREPAPPTTPHAPSSGTPPEEGGPGPPPPTR